MKSDCISFYRAIKYGKYGKVLDSVEYSSINEQVLTNPMGRKIGQHIFQQSLSSR